MSIFIDRILHHSHIYIHVTYQYIIHEFDYCTLILYIISVDVLATTYTVTFMKCQLFIQLFLVGIMDADFTIVNCY